ncbi:FAD-dependent thymidylate synthase [Desulfobulbus rhabdoformis]|uniref:FAD-dependent thymidylate synthase n=1 Tax=Desulfobulbus rhabdoformis TaxID=34032 RepID=UPI001964E6C3|nr:FAD-dependent thymidylate synthase [Desulfobulbus rhabdoformis]MBM9613261.1 FAD-dependent thymidylate synthase [Desulfobulbus rhabdoformis]
MRIIEPSVTILDELDQQSLPVRIEFCGRICYKSEDRIDTKSAIPFVRKMAEYGHNSVLEMGVTTFTVTARSKDTIAAFFLHQPKYLFIDRLDEQSLLISGSVRALTEMALAHPNDPIARALVQKLETAHPYFFETITWGPCQQAAEVEVQRMSLAQVEALPREQLIKHRYLAVKFIVNRAVTHELVRHRPCTFLQESQRYCRYSADKFGNEVTFIKPVFFHEGSAEYALWAESMEAMEKQYLHLLETSTPQAARTVLPNSCKTEIIVYANFQEWQHILALRTSPAAEPSMREVMMPLGKMLAEKYPAIFT